MISGIDVNWLINKEGTVVVPFAKDEEKDSLTNLASKNEVSLASCPELNASFVAKTLGYSNNERYYIVSTANILSKFHILPKSYYESTASMSAERFMYGYYVNSAIIKKWQKQISKCLKASYKRNAQKELVFYILSCLL